MYRSVKGEHVHLIANISRNLVTFVHVCKTVEAQQGLNCLIFIKLAKISVETICCSFLASIIALQEAQELQNLYLHFNQHSMLYLGTMKYCSRYVYIEIIVSHISLFSRVFVFCFSLSYIFFLCKCVCRCNRLCHWTYLNMSLHIWVLSCRLVFVPITRSAWKIQHRLLKLPNNLLLPLSSCRKSSWTLKVIIMSASPIVSKTLTGCSKT